MRTTKSEQLQIRVTRSQKAALRRRARAAGMDVSTYVLARALPPAQERFQELVSAVGTSEKRYALAAIHDLLTALAPNELEETLATADLGGLPPDARNTLAAMVEHAAAMKGAAPPAWVRDVEPLSAPHFATQLRSVRAHLLRVAPVAFRRRNLFVDATLGGRA